jgi:hypothetical protein
MAVMDVAGAAIDVASTAIVVTSVAADVVSAAIDVRRLQTVHYRSVPNASATLRIASSEEKPSLRGPHHIAIHVHPIFELEEQMCGRIWVRTSDPGFNGLRSLFSMRGALMTRAAREAPRNLHPSSLPRRFVHSGPLEACSSC